MTIYCFTNKSKSFSWWQLANFAQSHRALSCLFHDKWKLFWSPSIIPGTVTLTSLILCSTEQFRTSKPNQNPVLEERKKKYIRSSIYNIQSFQCDTFFVIEKLSKENTIQYLIIMFFASWKIMKRTFLNERE